MQQQSEVFGNPLLLPTTPAVKFLSSTEHKVQHCRCIFWFLMFHLSESFSIGRTTEPTRHTTADQEATTWYLGSYGRHLQEEHKQET